MSSIKPKKAPCLDCIEQGDYTEKYVTAKRCEYHYPLFRARVNKAKKVTQRPKTFTEVKQQAEGTTLGNWFKEQIKQCPNNCEECGKSIVANKQQGGVWASALIAHIVPKRKTAFPSVATKPFNRMFFCQVCHDKFDKRDNEYRATMKSLPIIKERLKTFYFDLTESERVRLEKYLPFDFYELEKEFKK